MKAKHTPGPWKETMVQIDLGEGHHCEGVSEIEPDICEMVSSRPINEVTANVRLIAAAPTLLCMLRRMLDEAGTSETVLKHFAGCTLEHARDAIELATGEKP